MPSPTAAVAAFSLIGTTVPAAARVVPAVSFAEASGRLAELSVFLALFADLLQPEAGRQCPAGETCNASDGDECGERHGSVSIVEI